MLMENLKILNDAVMTYTGGNKIWFLYAASLVLILAAGSRLSRQLFVIPVVILALTAMNPLFIGFLVRILGFENRYLRLLWVIPYYSAIGYCGTLLIFRCKTVILQSLAAAAVLAVILVIGTPVFHGESVPPYKLTENQGFVEDEIIMLSQICHSEGMESPGVLYPFETALKIRMYDPSIRTVWDHNLLLNLGSTPYDEFEKSSYSAETKTLFGVFFYGKLTVSPDIFRKAMEKKKLDYIITSHGEQALNDYLLDAGFVQKGITPSYAVWG